MFQRLTIIAFFTSTACTLSAGGGDGNVEPPAAVCGNNVVEQGEACDDGNPRNGDGCSKLCVSEERAICGDGEIDDGEECDDANNVQTDACTNACALAICGDGFIQAGVEACDDANNVQTDACLNTCVAARCGDGQVRAGVEACDDGNQVNGDGCENNCTASPSGVEFRGSGNMCNEWQTFRGAIQNNRSYTRIRFGRAGAGEFACNGGNANTICQALRAGSSTSVTCDGRSWGVRTGCSAQGQHADKPELYVDSGACSCNSRYSARPCIFNNNWGGWNTATCGSPAQTYYVICE
jgi:cysteine-rich repeat protein